MAQVWSHVYKCRMDQLDLKGPEAAYWIKKGILSTGDPYCVFRGLGAAIHKPSCFTHAPLMLRSYSAHTKVAPEGPRATWPARPWGPWMGPNLISSKNAPLMLRSYHFMGGLFFVHAPLIVLSFKNQVSGKYPSRATILTIFAKSYRDHPLVISIPSKRTCKRLFQAVPG